MTIKQQGGIFGRNPTFNDVEIDGSLTVGGSSADFTNVDAQDIDVRKQNDNVEVWIGEPDQSGLTTTGNKSYLTLSGIVGGTTEYGGIRFFRAHNNSRKIGAEIAHMRPATALDDSDLIFKTSTSNAHATEKMRILHSGGITFNGDTAAANALDDYEEGLFDVTAAASTSGTVTLAYTRLAYTKIGRMVFVNGEITVSSVSSPVGDITINSLPFTNSGLSQRSSRVAFFVEGFGFTGSPTGNVQATISAGGTAINIRLVNNFSFSSLASYLQAGSGFKFCFAYTAA